MLEARKDQRVADGGEHPVVVFRRVTVKNQKPRVGLSSAVRGQRHVVIIDPQGHPILGSLRFADLDPFVLRHRLSDLEDEAAGHVLP